MEVNEMYWWDKYAFQRVHPSAVYTVVQVLKVGRPTSQWCKTMQYLFKKLRSRLLKSFCKVIIPDSWLHLT